MDELNQVSFLYKFPPKVIKQNIENNKLIEMFSQSKIIATEAFDKLAYLAGIKNAPTDKKYSQLDTSNVEALLKSAELLGYDIEILSI